MLALLVAASLAQSIPAPVPIYVPIPMPFSRPPEVARAAPAPIRYRPGVPAVRTAAAASPKASPQSPPVPSPWYPPPFASASASASAPPIAGPHSGSGSHADVAVTSILRDRCVSCHAAPVASSKGAGIVLLDASGNLAPMSPALMLMVQEDCKTGRMPPGAPEMPDDELATVSGWVGDHSAEIASFLAQWIGR